MLDVTVSVIRSVLGAAAAGNRVPVEFVLLLDGITIKLSINLS